MVEESQQSSYILDEKHSGVIKKESSTRIDEKICEER